jgi:phosphatidate cytidylyltransferase
MNDLNFWILISVSVAALVAGRWFFIPAANRYAKTPMSKAVLSFISDRERNGWLLIFCLWAAVVIHPGIAVFMYGCTSFLGLREFLTRTPASGADYKALFVSFFILLPLQYILVGMGWYGMFSVFIPVYAFFLLPSLSALSGDIKEFFARAAKLQLGLMLSVYCISHIPAAMTLVDDQGNEHAAYLMFFIVVITQVADVIQYAVSRRWGKRRIARSVTRNNMTVEGTIAGVVGAMIAGLCLYWAVPFNWNTNMGVSATCAIAGFLGTLVLTGIKRSTGIKDWGEAIEGRSSVLDRLASLCFAAPVFYHLARAIL